jgi:AcrR family transcriptional regulator
VQKMDEREDLRVRRTRKMIQQAMIDLTVEKGFNNISVRDITERAMVNRSTFYRHYLDKCDLLSQYMREAAALTSEGYITERLPENKEEMPNGLMILLRHVQEHAAFYRAMFGVNGDPEFTEFFRKSAEKRFRFLLETYGERDDPTLPPTEMRINYVSHAGIGSIRWWLEHDQPCSVEQLARWIGRLSIESAGLPDRARMLHQ